MGWVVGAARGGHAGGGVAAGGATHLGFSAQPSNVTVNDVISPAVQVSALRGDGSTDTSYSGTVTVARGTGSSHLSGTLNQTAINGVASFNDLALDTVETGDTLTASAAGLTGATSSTFNVTSSGTSPFLVEDFSTYTSWNNWIADPRGIYSTAEDELTSSNSFLDTTTGVNINGYNLTQCVRYDYLAPGCVSQTIERNLKFPSVLAEVWFELYCKWTTNFTTKNVNGCGTPPDFKMFFLRSNAGLGRGAIRWGSQDPPEISVEILSAVDILTGTNISGYSDNTWHRLRGHWHINGTSSLIHLDIDGTQIYHNGSLNAGSSSPSFYGASFARNLDQGIPSGTMSQYWGRLAFFSADPGWGF